MRRGLQIGKILGIPILLDPSWLFIFGLLTYYLASAFAEKYPQWPGSQHWVVALFTSLLFFASILFHELSHSVVARHYKIRVVSITLFIFGGVARIGRDPSRAIQEFNIAIAGPIASFLLAAAFFAFSLVFPSDQKLTALTTYLSGTNLLLGLFNLAPGFPLDGGRIFRAIVWAITKDFPKATRAAGMSGKLIACGLIAFGAWRGLHDDLSGGIWYGLIGFYLLGAANDSVTQLAIRETLRGLSAADVMSQEVPIISGGISLQDYSEEVLRTGRRYHLVVTDDRLVGLMNVQALHAVPRDEWEHNSVQSVMIPRDRILWASQDEPLQRLLERLFAADINQMPVVSGSPDDGAHVVGIVSRDAILRVIQARSELRHATPNK
ncbi:MAG: site-2 protease family protein [Candidatus Acidiferrum sp.]|jgi:Zn-dependent protease/predicted transcriptional regulator